MQDILSADEIQLYKKQINLQKIGIEGQIKIKTAKVLVVGAGGLGCPILIYLLAAGIGNIGILDADKVELSNLNRQILYRLGDIDTYKVIAAHKNLNNINTECKISLHKYDLSMDNSIEIVSYYDIVLDATDNFMTRKIIDKTCYELNKIYIHGAVDNFDGQVGVFNYQNGIRYKNLYKLPSEDQENKCNTIGIMGITTGYIGILQAIETLKITIGLDKKSQDYLQIYKIDERFTKNKYIKLTRKIRTKKILSNKSENLYEYKKLSKNKYFLTIDVQSKENFTSKHMKKSINIPLPKIKIGTTINLLKKYKVYYKFKLYCPNDNRNTIASKILEQNEIKHEMI